MPKPFLNLDEVEPRQRLQGQSFESWQVPLGKLLGAQKLGAKLVVVPPGKRAWPFHNHHANEEMFFVLAGTGTLRFGQERYPIRAGDLISARAGGAETAHQIINTSESELRYLALSTMLDPEITEYPDSGKFGATAGAPPGGARKERSFSVVARSDANVDYWEGEG